MIKKPIKYKNQIVGYLDYMVCMYDIIQEAHFYIFDTEYYDEIISNIKRSFLVTFDEEIDVTNYKNNNLYIFEIKNDLLIIKKN